MGFGTPPEETFSTTILIVICLGIGIPSLLFIIGGIAIFVQKRRNRNPDFESLVD